MRSEPDHIYFDRRAIEEAGAAQAAAGAMAQRAHRDLSARYAQLAAAIVEADEKLGSYLAR